MSSGVPISDQVADELAQARAELREARRSLAVLRATTQLDPLCAGVAALENPFGVYDVRLRYLYANQRALQLWNKTEEQLLGHTDEEVFPIDWTQNYVPALKRAVELGKPQSLLVRLGTAPAEVLTLVCTYVPVRAYEGGPIEEVVWFSHDVTGLQLAFEERQRLEEQVQRAQKLSSVGVVVGGLAHDFNNLLTVILTMTQLSRMAVEDDAEISGYLAQTETAVNRASRLARQLLNYSGQRSPSGAVVSVNHVASEMVELLEPIIAKSATLRTEFSPHAQRVKCDAGQLRQVVMNLLTNANEALDGKAGEILVRTGSATTPGEGLSEGKTVYGSEGAGPYGFLEVTDTGCGLSDGALARMFEPFFTTKSSGRGLGMGVVLGIVRAHGGALVVDSTLGEGTVVRALFLRPTGDEELDLEPEDPTRGWDGDPTKGWDRPAGDGSPSELGSV